MRPSLHVPLADLLTFPEPEESAGSTKGALMEQLEQLSTIFDSMHALLYVADMDTYELLYINAYGEKLFGADALGHQCFRVLQAGQHAACPFCTNHRLIGADGEPREPFVWEFQNTVTGRWFQCIDRAIRWTDGRLVRMEVAVDVTERNRVEEFRNQYIHTITHDLRNPLMAILAHVDLLTIRLGEGGLEERDRRSLDGIGRAANRMKVMIQDLVDTARLEGGQVELLCQPVEIGPFVAGVLEEARGVFEVDRVEVRLAHDLPEADADPDRLERIMMNVISNAMKYSPAESPIRIEAAAAEDEIVFSVSDDGRGIHPADLPNLFERYYRTKSGRKSGGVGLGLYITRMLVEAHGGRIWVQSKLGVGSTFYFTIPIVSTAGVALARR
jgi:two-component system, OmpR family, phosphate regulon sensor histidine kinase PhoR